MAYQKYTTTGNETLQSLAKRMGMKNWKNLLARNKTILYNKNGTLKAGQKLNTNVILTPGEKIAKNVPDQSREGFEKKYGLERDLRPEAAFQQIAEEQVNPEQLRIARNSINAYDMGMSQSGAWRTGGAMRQRVDLLNQLERQRKEAVNAFIEPQRELFNQWYNKELEAYGKSKTPNTYTLSKFGIDIPGVSQQTITPGEKYSYATPFDYKKVFGYGAYGGNIPTYGALTQL